MKWDIKAYCRETEPQNDVLQWYYVSKFDFGIFIFFWWKKFCWTPFWLKIPIFQKFYEKKNSEKILKKIYSFFLSLKFTRNFFSSSSQFCEKFVNPLFWLKNFFHKQNLWKKTLVIFPWNFFWKHFFFQISRKWMKIFFVKIRKIRSR